MAGINTQLDGRGPSGPARASANAAPRSLYALLFRFGFFSPRPGRCLISFGSYGSSPKRSMFVRWCASLG